MPAPTLLACPCCGLVHRLPALGEGEVARCRRCRSLVHDPRAAARSNGRARALALAALVLLPAALGLPVLRIERFGALSDASVWSGARALLADGQWLVGAVVIVCSVVVPPLKLAGIVLLTTRLPWPSRGGRAATWRAIEWAGRWGMLDVLLVALMVAWLKIGELVEVRAGPGAVAFACCVLLSLLSSACFDPRAVWLRRRPAAGGPA